MTVTAVTLLMVAGACSSTPEVDVSSEGDDATSASSTPAAEESPAESAGEDEASAEPTAEAAAELGDPIASRKASVSGKQLRVDMYPVERRGTLADLNFTLTMVKGEGADDSLQISGLFADGNYDSIDSSGASVDGVRLLDGVNGKVHLAASDGNGNCLCTRDLSSTFLDAGDTVVLSATYAAPPEEVDAVSVQVPKFGTFTDVPVQ